MSNQDLFSLPSSTVRLLGSSQVITSVHSVVKELLENAIDANASAIEVKLDNFGLDRIEVRDNGTGIKSKNIPLVAKRYHTSKISAFSDLEILATYGFRGEALGSLCAVSSLSITSKSVEEDVSQCYTFDHQGNVTESQPSHLGQGTTICGSHLFRNLPVRRQFYNTVKKKKDELKKIEDLFMSYGAIRPELRLSLKNNKDLVWQKTVMADRKSALLVILGRNLVTQLEYRKVASKDPEVTIEAYLPKPDSAVSVTSRSTNDRCFVAVNQRPVLLKDVEKCVRQHYCHSQGCDGSRHPTYFLSLSLPGSQLDVNVDPNKTKVMLHHQKEILSLLTSLLEELYGPVIKPTKDTNDQFSNEDTTSLDSSNVSVVDSDSSFGSSDLPIIQCKSRKTGSNNGSGNVQRKGTHVGKDSTDSTVTNGVGIDFSGEFSRRNEEQNQVQRLDAELDGEAGSRSGLRISFYDSSKSAKYGEGNAGAEIDDNGVPERCSNYEELTNIEPVISIPTAEHGQMLNVNENGQLERNGTTHADSDSIDSNKVGSAVIPSSTQMEKGYFNLIDLEMEDVLATQEGSKSDSKYGTNTNDTDNVTNSEKVAGDTNDLSDTLDMLLDDSSFVDTPVLGGSSNKIQVSGTTGGVGGENCKQDNKNGDLSINPTTSNTGSEWSKGVSEKQLDGQTIEPVQLLTNSHLTKKRPSPCNDTMDTMFTPPAKKRLSIVPIDQPTIYDMVRQSPVDKYGVGFAAFSKEERPKIVEANQSADYDNVTDLVNERWNKLPDGIKQQYGKVEHTELETVNKKVKLKRRLSQKINTKLLPVKSGLPSIKDQLLAASKQKDDNKQQMEIKSAKTPFSLENLKQVYKTGTRLTQTQTGTQLQLIGPLKFYSGWACCRGNKILLLNPHRVEETLVHRELLEIHVLRTRNLEAAIRLNESNTGGKCLYNVLENLKTDNQTGHTYSYLDDNRLKANGFEIRCHSDQNGNIIMDLVGLATCMPTYGPTDLSEVLDLIHNTGAVTVYQSRPLKVIHYLQSEAVRMVRQRPLHRNHDDMLQQMTSLPADCDTCFHNKPFFHCIFDTNSLSSSQSSQSQ